MAIWNIDLTTQDGAWSAAQNGGYACYVVAVLGVLGVAMGAMAVSSGGSALVIGVLAVGLAEILVFAFAGYRLQAGKGVIWGSVAAVLLVLEIVGKLITLTGLPGLVINVIVLIVLVQGIRGAAAIKSGKLNADDAAAVFD